MEPICIYDSDISFDSDYLYDELDCPIGKVITVVPVETVINRTGMRRKERKDKIIEISMTYNGQTNHKTLSMNESTPFDLKTSKSLTVKMQSVSVAENVVILAAFLKARIL